MSKAANGPPTTTMKLFFSFHLPDSDVVNRVRHYLENHSPLKASVTDLSNHVKPVAHSVTSDLTTSDAFVLFAGRDFGKMQQDEAEYAYKRYERHDALPKRADEISLMVVQVEDEIVWPGGGAWVEAFQQIPPIKFLPLRLSATTEHGRVHEGHAQRAAQAICVALGWAVHWRPDFEIPSGYPFSYEKEIIREFSQNGGALSDKRVSEGCPREWPNVVKRDAARPNKVPKNLVGDFSDPEDRVVVDVRTGRDGQPPVNLTFSEARPREFLRLPRPERLDPPGASFNIGILVSGGIAPGINAVISGIVDRHNLYAHPIDPNRRAYPLEIHGYLNGFHSLAQPGVQQAAISMRLDEEPLKSKVKDDANRGGSLLGTSRLDALLGADEPVKREKTFTTMVNNLQGIDVLYVIGGDGSMRAAHALQVAHDLQRASDPNRNELTVVGIPKTMDNDILWVWQSFGFLSAVEKAKEFITQLRTEAESNPRLCVMQLFGSDSGFVVSHAAVASGVVDLALIPEIPFSMAKVSEYITDKLKAMKENPNHRRSPHGLVLMAETAIPTDVEKYIDEDDKRPNDEKILRLEREEREEIRNYLANDRRVRGQTPDALRTGGLKIVSHVLQHEIKNLQEFQGDYWSDFRVFTNEPRHLLRSLEPSSSDIIFGHRLGCLAVDNAMAGFTDFMVSQWLTEFVLVPLRLVVLGRKRVPRNGIFWRSVLDSTGQPAKLTND